MQTRTPAAEHDVDPSLVCELIEEQFPDLAGETIRLLDEGWDNFMYRVGETHIARLPRREVAVTLIENEQTWLPRLAERLPLPIPAPLRVGQAGCGYPWPWSLVPWLPGEAADVHPPSSEQAEVLADFLLALHQPAPPDAPENLSRGGSFSGKAEIIRGRLDRLTGVVDLPTRELLRICEDALEADGPERSVLLHGDLHARNVLVAEGRLSGIIDWGDLTSGDPATDLACAWMVFDGPEAWQVLFEGYGADDDLIARAKGWAVSLGSTLLETGLADHPRHAEIGERVLWRVGE